MGKQFYRTKSAREHKAKQELARNRNELAKALKKEGLDASKVFDKQKGQREESSKARYDAKHRKSRDDSEEVEAKRQAEREQRLEERKIRSRAFYAKTKKGQPKMKNVIDNLVMKLEKQRNAEQGN